MISIFLIIGAIEVTIANMAKAERSKTDQVYVVGFVPSYQLSKESSMFLGSIPASPCQ